MRTWRSKGCWRRYGALMLHPMHAIPTRRASAYDDASVSRGSTNDDRDEVALTTEPNSTVTDVEDHAVDTSSSSLAGPSSAVKPAGGGTTVGEAQRLLLEARIALQGTEGGEGGFLKEEEEGEDDPTLQRCAAVLKAVGLEDGDREGEEDAGQLAAILEQARLWARDARDPGQGEKGKEDKK